MYKSLTGNQLKLIAMVTMTVDHIGFILLPQVLWLRLIGRLAFPIYAWFIAEGCRHTRNMPRYLASVAAMALLCQLVSYVATGSLYQCILVTFSVSISLIFLLQKAKETKHWLWAVLFAVASGATWFVTETLPTLLTGTDYGVDYGFWGVILPIAVWIMSEKRYQLAVAATIMAVMSVMNGLQWFAFPALGLLALYNGKRGRHNIKWLFYFYYPAHLAALYLIAML